MVGASSTEVKLIERSGVYLTPLKPHHMNELLEHLSPENVREISLLGFDTTKDALIEMFARSDAYLARREGEPFLFAGGLWYSDDTEEPQMFALFSKGLKKNKTSMIRGSLMLMDFIDRTTPFTTMTILSDHEAMIQWAMFLGYEPVSIAQHDEVSYVELMRQSRCSRPVKH